jgi:hypothetical protein
MRGGGAFGLFDLPKWGFLCADIGAQLYCGFPTWCSKRRAHEPVLVCSFLFTNIARGMEAGQDRLLVSRHAAKSHPRYPEKANTWPIASRSLQPSVRRLSWPTDQSRALRSLSAIGFVAESRSIFYLLPVLVHVCPTAAPCKRQTVPNISFVCALQWSIAGTCTLPMSNPASPVAQTVRWRGSPTLPGAGTREPIVYVSSSW